MSEELPVTATNPPPKTPEHVLKTAAIALEMEGYVELATNIRGCLPLVESTSDYDDEAFNRGVTHTVDLLSKTIGAVGWVASDGSEDYDEDLAQTLLNILEAKGLYDSDDAKFSSEKYTQTSDALRLLWAEVVASGNATAKDYGWPKACVEVRKALGL